MINSENFSNNNCTIHIVIVNWNAGDQLFNCIESIKNYGGEVKLQITVVDNCSEDYSIKFLTEHPKVDLIENTKNYGFGKACNIGACKTDSEFLLFLNPDAALLPGSLSQALKFMSEPNHSDVGICGIQLIDQKNHIARSCARFPNPKGFIFHAIGLDRFFPKLGHFMAEWPHDTTQDVDQLIGAFFLVRRSLFKELGGFDERFFVYFEEVDFSYRARKAGWRSVYLADVQAYHTGGGTSNQVKAKRLFYSLRSRLLYAFKHFTLLGALLVLIATLLLEPISRSALAIGRRSWSSLVETWTGYGMLFRWLPQWWFKGITR